MASLSRKLFPVNIVKKDRACLVHTSRKRVGSETEPTFRVRCGCQEFSPWSNAGGWGSSNNAGIHSLSFKVSKLIFSCELLS